MIGVYHLYEYTLPDRDVMYSVINITRRLRPHIGEVSIRGMVIKLPLLWKTDRCYAKLVSGKLVYSQTPIYFFSIEEAITVNNLANGVYQAKRKRGWLEKKIDKLLSIGT